MTARQQRRSRQRRRIARIAKTEIIHIDNAGKGAVAGNDHILGRRIVKKRRCGDSAHLRRQNLE
ncbi:hypothetical protein D3C87_1993280 [compost metagenome]